MTTEVQRAEFISKAKKIFSDLEEMLIAKNKAYGNSALKPVKIFSKLEDTEQILVRIDDKLSRIAKGHEYPGDDTIDDLIGYLVLLKISRADKKKDDYKASCRYDDYPKLGIYPLPTQSRLETHLIKMAKLREAKRHREAMLKAEQSKYKVDEYLEVGEIGYMGGKLVVPIPMLAACYNCCFSEGSECKLSRGDSYCDDYLREDKNNIGYLEIQSKESKEENPEGYEKREYSTPKPKYKVDEELAIGEIGYIKGKLVLCTEEHEEGGCVGCVFEGASCYNAICSHDKRMDDTGVIFKEIKDVKA